MSGRSNAVFELRMWAEEEGMEILALKPCGRPPDSVMDQFPRMAYRDEPFTYAHSLRFHIRYFELTTIDADHVRRSGVARVRSEVHDSRFDLERMIDFVCLTSVQLNWRDRPPRRSAQSPHGRAEGWYADHTGVHELRWYSMGTPTDLVKDGAIESRDPPAALSEST